MRSLSNIVEPCSDVDEPATAVNGENRNATVNNLVQYAFRDTRSRSLVFEGVQKAIHCRFALRRCCHALTEQHCRAFGVWLGSGCLGPALPREHGSDVDEPATAVNGENRNATVNPLPFRAAEMLPCAH
jgi:hypothetical protein